MREFLNYIIILMMLIPKYNINTIGVSDQNRHDNICGDYV